MAETLLNREGEGNKREHSERGMKLVRGINLVSWMRA